MNRKLLVALSLVVVALGLLVAQSPSKSISPTQSTEAINKQMAELQHRLAMLEHASGAPAEPAHPSAVPPPPGATERPIRTMIVDGIHQEDSGPDHSAEINQLQGQVNALGQTLLDRKVDLDEEPEDANTYSGSRGVGGWGNDGYYSRTSHSDAARDRAVISRRNVVNTYGTVHAMKKRKLEALKRAQNEPHQVVVGHDGPTIITLHTKHNLQEEIDKISENGRCTWRGNRIDADEHSETWVITSIHPVEVKAPTTGSSSKK